jgi:hypothetical protein
MLSDRLIHSGDLPILAESLARDEFHKATTPEFFMEPGTICKVYEDEVGPICFVRGSKALRLDIQYADNNDTVRNKEAMLWGFDKLIEKARENGFNEVIFCTNSKLLSRFCRHNFGFTESHGELRKLIA